MSSWSCFRCSLRYMILGSMNILLIQGAALHCVSYCILYMTLMCNFTPNGPLSNSWRTIYVFVRNSVAPVVLVVETFGTEIVDEYHVCKVYMHFHFGWMKPQKHMPLKTIFPSDPLLPLIESGFPGKPKNVWPEEVLLDLWLIARKEHVFHDPIF